MGRGESRGDSKASGVAEAMAEGEAEAVGVAVPVAVGEPVGVLLGSEGWPVGLADGVAVSLSTEAPHAERNAAKVAAPAPFRNRRRSIESFGLDMALL